MPTFDRTMLAQVLERLLISSLNVNKIRLFCDVPKMPYIECREAYKIFVNKHFDDRIVCILSSIRNDAIEMIDAIDDTI